MTQDNQNTRYSMIVSLPRSLTSDSMMNLIRDAADYASSRIGVPIDVYRSFKEAGQQFPSAILLEAFRSSDLYIVDTSGFDSGVVFDVGFAHAMGKTIIPLTDSDSEFFPPLATHNYLVYDAASGLRSLGPRLADHIERSLAPQTPANTDSGLVSETSGREEIFICYSHADLGPLNRLLIHLRPLEKMGHIHLWSDRNISPGDDWKAEIESALKRAKVAVMLISADFLASDFVTDNEIPPLLEAAEAEGVRILPLVLKPCRFLRDANLSRFQAVNDPSAPLLMLPEMEQEALYARSAELIEQG